MGFEGRRKPVVIHTLWLMEMTPLQLGPAPGTAGWLLPSPRTSESAGHSAVCVAARRAAIPYPLLLSGKPFCVWTRVQLDTAGPGSHSAAPCVTEHRLSPGNTWEVTSSQVRNHTHGRDYLREKAATCWSQALASSTSGNAKFKPGSQRTSFP